MPIWIELLYEILYVNLIISSKNRISHIHNLHTHINIPIDRCKQRSYSFHSKVLTMNQVNTVLHSGLCSSWHFYPNYVAGRRNQVKVTCSYMRFTNICGEDSALMCNLMETMDEILGEELTEETSNSYLDVFKVYLSV